MTNQSVEHAISIAEAWTLNGSTDAFEDMFCAASVLSDIVTV